MGITIEVTDLAILSFTSFSCYLMYQGTKFVMQGTKFLDIYSRGIKQRMENNNKFMEMFSSLITSLISSSSFTAPPNLFSGPYGPYGPSGPSGPFTSDPPVRPLSFGGLVGAPGTNNQLNLRNGLRTTVPGTTVNTTGPNEEEEIIDSEPEESNENEETEEIESEPEESNENEETEEITEMEAELAPSNE